MKYRAQLNLTIYSHPAEATVEEETMNTAAFLTIWAVGVDTLQFI